MRPLFLARMAEVCGRYGSRKLDAAIGRLVGDWEHDQPTVEVSRGWGGVGLSGVPFYTTVMTDAQRLCQGQWEAKYVHVGLGDFMGYARATPGDNLNLWFDAWAATPELALTAANIKARFTTHEPL
jgi:hypothetical protein